MKNGRLIGLAAAALGAATIVVAPAAAFRGGGGFGGMHGGGMHGGGMHGGGMHFGGGLGGMRGGAAHFGGGGFRGGMAFGPRAGAPFIHQRVVLHNSAFRRHHRFNNVVFVGAPYVGLGYGDSCWRRIWTYYGWQWANICGDYGY